MLGSADAVAQAHVNPLETSHYAEEDSRIYHVDFQPLSGCYRASSAPVTEVARFYYDESPPEGILDGFHEFGRLFDSHKMTGACGYAAGLSREGVQHGEAQAKIIVVLIGWTSIADHEAFQKTRLFKDHVPLFQADKARKVEIHHTAFSELC
jgi:hypothetical protein